VDLRVAHRARLILGGLVVERRRARRRSIHVRRMASEAKEIDVIDLQHARIRRSVRCVARKAALIGFHRSVLENERPHRIRMALRANRKLPSGSSHLVTGLSAVRIVAVAALDESNVYPVPVRSRKFRLLRGMAAVAQGRLRFCQHKVHVGGAVGTVTRSTAHAIG